MAKVFPFTTWMGCTEPSSIAAPSAPTNVIAAGGTIQATVSFSASTDNGSPVTGYTVSSNPAGLVDSQAGTTGLSHVITGLVSGTTYTFTVTATNAVGTSAPSTPSNSVTANGSVAQAYYIHADHLDTPRQITDTAGNIVWQWDNSDPFGNNTPNENPSGQGAFENPLRFPGQYADKETNTYYNYFRDYDPATGRYIESDPIGLEGGINTYTYVEGNPLSKIDPLGLWSFGLELYAGLGGGFTFGRDSVTGQAFVNFRVGYGVGGGFDYDPLAKRPGSDPCDKGSGEAIGVYGKVGGRAGPVKGGLGFNAGLENGSSAYPTNPYGSFASPKISFTNQGTGISASAAAGGEITIYGRGQ